MEGKMSVKYAILGFLSWKSFTGYELKKMFAESVTLAWSGNSNQVYTPLVDLHKEGLVSLEVQPQKNHPPRKVYTITEQGLAELKSWVLAVPEPPVQKNSFLMQFAWADRLSPKEMDALLEKYEEKLQTHLLMFRARDQHKEAPQRTLRETYLWNMISENWFTFYENELHWVRKVRAELMKMKSE